MKKLCYSLFFLFISFQLFSQENEKLPKIPWAEIVELNNTPYTKLNKWINDINISLEGLYTTSDSLKINRIIKKLDSLTETINIKFTNINNSNLKIKFLDSLISDTYNKRTDNTLRAQSLKGIEGYVSGALYIYKNDQTDLQIQNSLESKIAKLLVFNNFNYKISKGKRKSIFNPYIRYNNSNVSLNNQDQIIIKEVYRTGFKERLKKAENKYKSSVIERINKTKTLNRDESIWWVKNPIAIIILPFLVLLFSFTMIALKVNKLIVSKIKKSWIQFGVIALIAIFFTWVLIVLSVSLFDYLTIPDDYRIVPFVRYDTVLTTAVALLFSFPFFYLFRFIELKIKKVSKSITTKTLLIFLSTGFLPFTIVSVLFFIGIREGQNHQGGYLVLSKMFVGAMIIASIRALISYFIFKERNIIVENENKLSHLRELKTKAELKSLQAQINPHFLYNSLNSIASLAKIDADKTQQMAYSLSDLFKYSINRKGENTSTIKEEVEMVKTYLEIEKIRFEDHLKFTIEVDKTLENKKIPLFLIQPLVENAVKHGISKNIDEGKISIQIEKINNEICISVSDNGPDFPEGLLSGHGLQTVYDLLRLNYKENASLNWTNTPQKTITISIQETV
tara:strand:+ start:956 stop:2818 length:1863 start_codon:yes stop_codon:yes gene_type:complete